MNWNLAKLLSKLFGFWSDRRYTSFKGLAVVTSGADADEHVQARKLVLVGTANRPKWLHFQCPCKCGETLSLNLMDGHYPRWTVQVHPDDTISVRPSVDATTCNAHFWIQRNRVKWV